MQKNNKGKRKDQAKPETGSEKKQKQKERGVSAQRHRLIANQSANQTYPYLSFPLFISLASSPSTSHLSAPKIINIHHNEKILLFEM
jgi:hypothetical protein